MVGKLPVEKNSFKKAIGNVSMVSSCGIANYEYE